jgi:hypothetical protein
MSGFLGILFPGSGAGGLPPVTPSVYLAYGGVTAGKRITVYNWNSSSGFGSIFAAPPIASSPSQVSFVRNNSVFSARFAPVPFYNVWQWSSLGFGTQYANPASALNPNTGGATGFTWTNNVDAFLTANAGASSFPQAWAWSQASGFGTKYSNGALISNFVPTTGVSLNGDNTQVAFSGSASSIISLYRWSSASGFGTKYANPPSPPPMTTYIRGVLSFNLVTNDIAVGGTGIQKILAYAVSSSGFGTRYSDPGSPINGSVYSVRFNPTGSSISVGGNDGSQPLRIYQWGAGFGSLYAGPPLSQTVNSSDWSSTGTEIAISQTSSAPYTSVYPWSLSGIGSAYSNPATDPGVSVCVSFSNQSR